MDKQIDSPGVVAPPPLIFIGGIILAIVMNWLMPVAIVPGGLSLPLGISLVVIGAVVIWTAVRTFVRRGTNVDVRKPAEKIVTVGPYRFSRNPIYVGMTLFALGVGILINTFWILAAFIPVYLVILNGVIEREEAYLAQKFGEEYLKYKASVRRWI